MIELTENVRAQLEENMNWQCDWRGRNSRLVLLAEECGELTQACMKMLRPDVDEHIARAMLVEEMADVLICIEQNISIYNMEDDVHDMIVGKIERDKARRMQPQNYTAG